MPLRNRIGFIGSGLEINGIIESYKVAAGDNISAGSFVEYINVNKTEGIGREVLLDDEISAGNYMSAVPLDNQRVFLVWTAYPEYTQGSMSYYAKTYAQVITISDMTITTGTTIRLTMGSTSQGHGLSACLLGENKVFVVAAQGTYDINSVQAAICTITGSMIEQSSSVSIMDSSSLKGYGSISAVKLDDYRVFVSTYMGRSTVCTISGNTITKGTVTIVNNNVYECKPILLSSNKLFLVGCDGDEKLSCNIISVSGTTLSASSPIILPTLNYAGIKFEPIKVAENRVFIAYGVNTTTTNTASQSSHLHGIVCNISGTSITSGTGTQIAGQFSGGSGSVATLWITSILLDENKVALIYSGSGGTKIRTIEVMGTNFSVIDSGYSDFNRITGGDTLKLNSTSYQNGKFLLLYKQSSGFYVVIKQLPYTAEYIRPFRGWISGVAKTSGTEEENIEVYVPENGATINPDAEENKPTSFVTLGQMFARANAYSIAGRNSSSTGTVSITNIPTTGTYYGLSLCDGYIGVYKLKNGKLTSLYRSSTSYAALYLNGTTLYYSHNGTSSASVYGATITLFTFSNTEEELIDEALSNLTVEQRNGRNLSSAAVVSLSSSEISTCDVVFCCYDKYLTVYDAYSYANTPIVMFNAGSKDAAGYMQYNGYIPSGAAVYGGSLIAVNSTNLK